MVQQFVSYYVLKVLLNLCPVYHSLLLYVVLLFLVDSDWSTGRHHPDTHGRGDGGH